jgi:hypothetical protein
MKITKGREEIISELRELRGEMRLVLKQHP